MTETLSLIEKLEGGCPLNLEELTGLVQNWENVDVRTLRAKAGAACEKHYGRDVYLRGLIEVSNYCKNDCFYCGIRKSNGLVKRYRLTEEQILACCERGYELGLRTFVLQGGEDS